MHIKLRDLCDRIGYELAEGIHTYHRCECGRYSTRRGECAMCLLEKYLGELDSLKEK